MIFLRLDDGAQRCPYLHCTHIGYGVADELRILHIGDAQTIHAALDFSIHGIQKKLRLCSCCLNHEKRDQQRD
ncbi:hypothetical protein DSECCO2_557390 [anaerobic digester metagenome]